VDRHHAFHNVGNETGILATDPLFERISRAERTDIRSLDRVPGIWFFSLDASNPVAALVARLTFHLPYFHAHMSLERRNRTLRFASRRTRPHSASTEFKAVWTVGDRLPQSKPGSLRFFLTERYALYSARKDTLYRAHIFHRPWPLHEAHLLSFRSTMLGSQGLPAPGDAPLLHQQGEPLRVRIWPRVRIR
jgi:uncharacterized protein